MNVLVSLLHNKDLMPEVSQESFLSIFPKFLVLDFPLANISQRVCSNFWYIDFRFILRCWNLSSRGVNASKRTTTSCLCSQIFIRHWRLKDLTLDLMRMMTRRPPSNKRLQNSNQNQKEANLAHRPSNSQLRLQTRRMWKSCQRNIRKQLRN